MRRREGFVRRLGWAAAALLGLAFVVSAADSTVGWPDAIWRVAAGVALAFTACVHAGWAR